MQNNDIKKIKYPVIAITGSSGAGTSTVKNAFGNVLRREGMKAVFVEGDSFHRYNRTDMKKKVEEWKKKGKKLTHFNEAANLFDKQAELFKIYRETGKGKIRHYIHNQEEAEQHNQNPGEFTEWEDIKDSDLLLYEGLHGGVPEVLPFVDLLIGVVPIINLEWIQKIHRDGVKRGYSAKNVVDSIKFRLNDYVDFITPQFQHTHINFQRIPTVDTSNPFIAREVPTRDESLVVVRIKKEIILKYKIDISRLKNMIEGSFISRRNTLVIPGAKMQMAMEIIVTPIIEGLVRRYNRNR
jgi:phosphoribulokinase